jgi:hypothetical protein
MFPTYHASLPKWFNKNNASLFPSHKLGQPGPVITEDGLEEYHIKKIINKQKQGCGVQYLIQWSGYSERDDLWLPQHKLENCEVLDQWKACMVEEMQ